MYLEHVIQLYVVVRFLVKTVYEITIYGVSYKCNNGLVSITLPVECGRGSGWCLALGTCLELKLRVTLLHLQYSSCLQRLACQGLTCGVEGEGMNDREKRRMKERKKRGEEK